MILFKDRKLRPSVWITFLVSTAIAALIIGFSLKMELKHSRQQCELISQTATRLFRTSLSQNMPLNDNVEGMIMATDGNITNFEDVISSLIQQFPAVFCVQLAPKGITSKCYPPISDLGLIKNFFSNPATKITSVSAVVNRKSYLTGPYFLENGKPVLLIQDPVFLRNKKIQGEFWGFTAIYLNVDQLFDQDTLNYLEYSDPSFYYRLCKLNFADDDEYLLVENTDKFIKDPCVTTFTVKESTMILYTAPKAGWINVSNLTTKCIITLIICMGLSLLVGLYFSLKERWKNFEILSFKDPLTELYNARKFKLVLKNLQKSGEDYAVIYLDLNGFKQINDTLGHAAGDKILIISARKILHCIREKDLAFRLGGDEFAVIIHGSQDESFIGAFIDRIKKSIQRETILQESRMKVTTSAGYARCPQDGTDSEQVVKAADEKMYEDKRRNREEEQL